MAWDATKSWVQQKVLLHELNVQSTKWPMLKDETLEAQPGSIDNRARCQEAAPKMMGKGEILTVSQSIIKLPEWWRGFDSQDVRRPGNLSEAWQSWHQRRDRRVNLLNQKNNRVHLLILFRCTRNVLQLNHMLGHKTSPNKHKRVETVSSIVPNQNGMIRNQLQE